MAFSFSPKIATDGLILYLDAANTKSYVNGSTTWNDLSSTNTSFSLVNSPTFNSSNSGSIVFNGSTNYASGTLNISNSPFTIICWVYPNVSPTEDVYFSVGTSETLRNAIHLRLVDNTTFNFGMYNDDLSVIVSSVTNKWNCFAVTLTSGFVQSVYQNGVLVGSPRTASNYFTGNDVCNIGRWGITVPIQYINARVATSCVYNRALSSTEILQNYNSLKGRFGL